MGRNYRRPVLFALSVVLWACGGGAATTTAVPATTGGPAETTAAIASGELSVLEWAYYEVPEMWVEFGAAHPDVTPVFNFGASDPDIFAKYLAGSGEDVVHFYTPYLRFYVDEGLIQPIDTSRMANWSKVPPLFQESCTIDGVVYCVPWDWGFTSILYRTDKIPEGITSWEGLFDEKYSGHLSIYDCGDCAVNIAAALLGYDPLTITEEQLAEIRQLYIDQKPHVLFYWADEPTLEAGFKDESIWAAYAWNGAYYRLLGEGVPVAYADPAEGRESWIGQYGISATTENYDLALEFLDGKLGEETATHLLVDYAYGHVVPDYFDAVTDENLIKALSLDDPTVLDRTNFTPQITREQLEQFVAMWAEVQAAS